MWPPKMFFHVVFANLFLLLLSLFVNWLANPVDIGFTIQPFPLANKVAEADIVAIMTKVSIFKKMFSLFLLLLLIFFHLRSSLSFFNVIKRINKTVCVSSSFS